MNGEGFGRKRLQLTLKQSPGICLLPLSYNHKECQRIRSFGPNLNQELPGKKSGFVPLRCSVCRGG
jgi:hypothetical protein